ncbi:MAG: GFA family protein [Pseudomonadota bacterium]
MSTGHCGCGNVSFEISGQPLFRMRCHCTICQRFNQAPFADVVIFRADDVGLPAEGTVDYQSYKAPPNVQRGRCAACGQAAFERFEMALFPKLRMVPAALLPSDELPDVRFDAFYDKRVRDIEDNKPKHEGFWASQRAFLQLWRASRAGKRFSAN